MSEFRQLGEITAEVLALIAAGQCLQCEEPCEEFLCPRCRSWLDRRETPRLEILWEALEEVDG